jgi:hypothetical protein
MADENSFRFQVIPRIDFLKLIIAIVIGGRMSIGK